MMKPFSLLLMLALCTAAWGQSPRSAVGGEGGLWAGGEISIFNPDFSCTSSIPFNCGNQLLGLAPFFDFDMYSRWGAEGEARWLHWNGYGGEVESNYLVGPRFRLFHRGRISGWGKVLFGGGWITTPGYPQAGSLQGSYFAYVPGGTLNYRLSDRLTARADYEYQFWPSFVGPPTLGTGSSGVISHNHGLTPNGFSFGFAWRFLGQ